MKSVNSPLPDSRVGSSDFKISDFFKLKLSNHAETLRIDAAGEVLNVADYDQDPDFDSKQILSWSDVVDSQNPRVNSIAKRDTGHTISLGSPQDRNAPAARLMISL